MAKSKIITYVAVALLVLVGLYWVYHLATKDSKAEEGGVVLVSEMGLEVSETDSQANKFIKILKDIDSIDLQNLRLLDDKIFTSLKDFGRAIEDRVLGRGNPFAPLSEGGETGLVKKGTVAGNNIDLETSSTTEPDNNDETISE